MQNLCVLCLSVFRFRKPYLFHSGQFSLTVHRRYKQIKIETQVNKYFANLTYHIQLVSEQLSVKDPKRGVLHKQIKQTATPDI